MLIDRVDPEWVSAFAPNAHLVRLSHPRPKAASAAATVALEPDRFRRIRLKRTIRLDSNILEPVRARNRYPLAPDGL